VNDRDRVVELTESQGLRRRNSGALKRGIAAVAAIVVLGVAAAPASADWAKPVPLTSPAAPFTFGDPPSVAVEPDGSFLTAWVQSLPGPKSDANIDARTVDANGNLGPVLTLTTTHGDVRNPRIAITPGGGATVLWNRNVAPQQISLEARRINPNGSLGPVITVSEPNERALGTSLTTDSAGKTTVAWVHQINDSSVLRVRQISANGALGPEQTLTKTGEGRVVGVAVAVGPDGRPLVVYDQFGQIKAVRLSASGIPLPGIAQLSSPDDTSSSPSAKADAAGVVHVSWGRTAPDPLQVFARTVAPDGTLGAMQTVASNRSAGSELAVNAAGDASVAWQDTPQTDPVSVQASTIPAGGDPGSVFRISALSQNPGLDPQVGIDAQGTSLTVWEVDLGTAEVVQSGRFSGAGLLGNVKTLASFKTDIVASPNVAVNPNGRALALWWQGNAKATNVTATAALFTPPASTPPVAGAPDPRCHGKRADIVGTGRADDIVGTSGRDVIVGRGGADKIRGHAGNDLICGNGGRDRLRGGRGHDRLFGGPGRDTKRP
jgi:RTX calcium-binding nonapeptide repeat (4 copies)